LFYSIVSFQKKKLNRDEFDAFKNQENDLFDRLAALERDYHDNQSKRRTVSNTDPFVFFLLHPILWRYVFQVSKIIILHTKKKYFSFSM
jgi:hypothetical protein